MIESAVGQAPVKPGCKEHCGNVSFPYPFGIRADCYMHKEFEVSCGETSNPPTNLLTSIETEVLYFSLDHSIVNVKIPITSQQCSVSSNFLDFSGSPLMSYKGRMLLLPEGYVPALLDRVITDEDASQLPYRYDHAFNCSQFNGTIANSSFFIILLPSVPYGCQEIDKRNMTPGTFLTVVGTQFVSVPMSSTELVTSIYRPLECKKTLSAPLDKVKPLISATIPEYQVGICHPDCLH
ncbi:hypothetical protein SLEP1_g36124 [Rubroshorea leprosula]|uniref:Wall-associated receptor kinase galacturonan-binding domain-containing protein n=1 Tax=Rubroshorea leprosula TaxID=152421 RepID=A0AAV5KQH3_9ROSI|nr:hypothetical protein SLEP1_g36124 [Rubroshorea leprosula]